MLLIAIAFAILIVLGSRLFLIYIVRGYMNPHQIGRPPPLISHMLHKYTSCCNQTLRHHSNRVKYTHALIIPASNIAS
jgi:hypothetical protein